MDGREKGRSGRRRRGRRRSQGVDRGGREAVGYGPGSQPFSRVISRVFSREVYSLSLLVFFNRYLVLMLLCFSLLDSSLFTLLHSPDDAR